MSGRGVEVVEVVFIGCLDEGRVTLCATLSYRSLSPRDWKCSGCIKSKYLCHSVRLIWIRKKPIQKTNTDQVYVTYSVVLGAPLSLFEIKPPGLEKETTRSRCKKRKKKENITSRKTYLVSTTM